MVERRERDGVGVYCLFHDLYLIEFPFCIKLSHSSILLHYYYYDALVVAFSFYYVFSLHWLRFVIDSSIIDVRGGAALL